MRSLLGKWAVYAPTLRRPSDGDGSSTIISHWRSGFGRPFGCYITREPGGEYITTVENSRFTARAAECSQNGARPARRAAFNPQPHYPRSAARLGFRARARLTLTLRAAFFSGVLFFKFSDEVRFPSISFYNFEERAQRSGHITSLRTPPRCSHAPYLDYGPPI
jgi:hypothetical protein